MRSLSEPDAQAEISRRVQRIEPTSQRMWGKMESGQMLSHVADQLRLALRDLPTGPPRGPFRFAPMRFLLIHVLPWPKGRAQGPREAFTTPPASWEDDRRALLDLVGRFGEASADGLAPTHPLFGRMTARDWGVLSYRHLDHHLRQFSG